MEPIHNLPNLNISSLLNVYNYCKTAAKYGSLDISLGIVFRKIIDLRYRLSELEPEFSRRRNTFCFICGLIALSPASRFGQAGRGPAGMNNANFTFM